MPRLAAVFTLGWVWTGRCAGTPAALALALSCALMSPVGSAGEQSVVAVELVQGLEPTLLTGQVGVLRDEVGEWTLDDVMYPSRAVQFEYPKDQTIARGFTDAAYWYRFDLRSPGSETGQTEQWIVSACLEMRDRFESLRANWVMVDAMSIGIGISDGFASIGVLGFEGRMQYAAIGTVTNLASRLCEQAQAGELLASSRVLLALDGKVRSRAARPETFRGFQRTVEVGQVLDLQESGVLTY